MRHVTDVHCPGYIRLKCTEARYSAMSISLNNWKIIIAKTVQNFYHKKTFISEIFPNLIFFLTFVINTFIYTFITYFKNFWQFWILVKLLTHLARQLSVFNWKVFSKFWVCRRDLIKLTVSAATSKKFSEWWETLLGETRWNMNGKKTTLFEEGFCEIFQTFIN